MSTTTTVTEAPTLVAVTQHPEITAENVSRLFPEVNTDLIGGAHNSARSDDALEGYDEEQIKLMDEVCIVLDNNDIPIGSGTKKLCEYIQDTATRLSCTCRRQQHVRRVLTRDRPSHGEY